MALGYFETTTGQKQLADIGRQMMDMSEYANCKGMKEEGFKELNDLSHVGNMLTKVGIVFGVKESDFTAEDKDLIARFVKKEIDIPQM
jgi:signal transduction histidine kinase|tara:strand:+ start:115 stop:378 length:264 start_codon:yes stop_codon:yes gene_type:complete